MPKAMQKDPIMNINSLRNRVPNMHVSYISVSKIYTSKVEANTI